MGNFLEIVKARINKYWIAAGMFLFFFLFLNENNLFKRLDYNRQINQLEKEIDLYTTERDANQKKLNMLSSDKEGLEKLAREQYQMVKPNEEVFIIRE